MPDPTVRDQGTKLSLLLLPGDIHLKTQQIFLWEEYVETQSQKSYLNLSETPLLITIST